MEASWSPREPGGVPPSATILSHLVDHGQLRLIKVPTGSALISRGCELHIARPPKTGLMSRRLLRQPAFRNTIGSGLAWIGREQLDHEHAAGCRTENNEPNTDANAESAIGPLALIDVLSHGVLLTRPAMIMNHRRSGKLKPMASRERIFSSRLTPSAPWRSTSRPVVWPG